LYLYHNNAQESKENTVPAIAPSPVPVRHDIVRFSAWNGAFSGQGKTSWQGRC